MNELLICPKCRNKVDEDHNSFWCDRCQMLWPKGAGHEFLVEGYYRIKGEHEKLKALCAIIEPWAANHACNNRSVSKMADDVYRACVEMRRIIYSPNNTITTKEAKP